MTDRPALQLDGLSVAYRVKGRSQRILHDIDLTIGRGAAYGLVGEMGCGKSTAAFAILRYLSRNGTVEQGRVLIDGQDCIGWTPGPCNGCGAIRSPWSIRIRGGR